MVRRPWYLMLWTAPREITKERHLISLMSTDMEYK